MPEIAQPNQCPPLVSVAMITYNHGPYVEKAIDGVLRQQTDFRVELIIGEDCSTDGTRQIVLDVQRRCAQRVRVITSETNVGMHENLLRVEMACSGKYIAYCEGDDYWNDASKLVKQVALLESSPDYIMAHSHCHRYLVAKRRLLANSLTVPQDLKDTDAYSDILLGRRYPLTVTIMARRSEVQWILDHCPECTDKRWPMGDTQRWLELSRRGKVGCIHLPLATTNVLPESAGQSKDLRKRLRFYAAARELHLHYLNKYPLPPHLDRAVRLRLAAVLLQHAYAASDYHIAQKMWAEQRAISGRSTLLANFLVWGSYSRPRYLTTLPLTKAIITWRRLAARMGLTTPGKEESRAKAPLGGDESSRPAAGHRAIKGTVE